MRWSSRTRCTVTGQIASLRSQRPASEPVIIRDSRGSSSIAIRLWTVTSMVDRPTVFHCILVLVLALLPATTLEAADVKNGFDVSDAVVPSNKIYWGGVGRDGIPAIDAPKFVTPQEAEFLRDWDRVLGVFHNGIARAYPIKIMEKHEVVNDVFADQSLVVTYCPLCFSGMSFVTQGKYVRLTFGVSGLLYNSDVLLYDRQTESLWSQILTLAVSGPLKGTRLAPIPTAHTTWRDWRNRYPQTQVLSFDTGFRRRYGTSPYADYQRSRQLMFPVANRSNRYSTKAKALGVSVDGHSKAYHFMVLRKNGSSTFVDTIDGKPYTIHWSEDDDYAQIVDSDGKELPSVIVYWFAWYAFHPDTLVFEVERASSEMTDKRSASQR
jgi:hypothetical protein